MDNSYFQYGGKITDQERRRRADYMRNSPQMKDWRNIRKNAYTDLQEAKAREGGPQKYNSKTGKHSYIVSSDEINNLARQYSMKKNPYYTPRQSPNERARRVHGMGRRELRKYVTESKAIRKFLDYYENESRNGHMVNARGTRKYPSKGAVYDRMKDKSLAGQVIPQRRTYDFTNARQALLTRVMRTAGKSPVNGKVNGREVIRACPDSIVNKRGVITREAAKKANCENSNKLNLHNAPKNFQVEDVSYFRNPTAARNSPLLKEARSKLTNSPNRKKTNPTWLAPYHRKKGQTVDERNSRIAPLRAEAAKRRENKLAANRRSRSNQSPRRLPTNDEFIDEIF
jgi:hypothetical protein